MLHRSLPLTGVIALCGALGVGSSGCSGDPSITAPAEVAEALAKASTGQEQQALQVTSRMLRQADADGRIDPARRKALSDLYNSAMRDGRLSEDERTLLTTTVHDLAASLE